jgi:hypothetical protein
MSSLYSDALEKEYPQECQEIRANEREKTINEIKHKIEEVIHRPIMKQSSYNGSMTKLIIDDRQTGRSTKLIKECSKYRYAIIVCPTHIRAKILFDYAKDIGYPIPLPISFEEFVEGRFFGRNIDAFFFDDLDESIRQMAHCVPVKGIVMLKDNGG